MIIHLRDHDRQAVMNPDALRIGIPEISEDIEMPFILGSTVSADHKPCCGCNHEDTKISKDFCHFFSWGLDLRKWG